MLVGHTIETANENNQNQLNEKMNYVSFIQSPLNLYRHIHT